MIRIALSIACASLCAVSSAQGQWLLQSSGTDAEFRGLSAVSDSVVWAAGRDGAFARTVDGGATWEADTVAGATDLFFIDVHAIDDSTAILLGTSFDGGRAGIYRTTDGGDTWVQRYANSSPGVFFDGMAFWDALNGVAFSDPVDGSFLIVTTADGGASWEPVPAQNIPPPLPGEAGFAASGTAISVAGDSHVWIGTGGGAFARVLMSSDRGRSWTVAETPLPANASTGIFGLAFRDPLNGVAVGGNYQAPGDSSSNVLRTRDGGVSWSLVGRSRPNGVRYGAVYARAGDGWALVAVGPSGWGYSADDGATWTFLDNLSYNTVAAAPSGLVWAAGVDGRIARFTPPVTTP